MNKFLNNVSQNKQLTRELYSNFKKEIPKANIGELVRDFRIDEEDGMEKDPRLEFKDVNEDKIKLADKLFQLTRV